MLVKLTAMLLGGGAALAVAQPTPSIAPTPPRLRAGSITPLDYPPEALRADARGIVGMSIEVGANGRVTGCTVTQSAGHPALDAAACPLVLTRFRYAPATRDGQPVSANYKTKIKWDIMPTWDGDGPIPPGAELVPAAPHQPTLQPPR